MDLRWRLWSEELKYWDGTQFQDEFPAGVAIGFFLQPNGFSNNNGTIENPVKGNAWNATKYSSPNLNYQGEKRTIALLDAISTQMVTIGFEDGKDNNFSDATFYLDIEQKDAGAYQAIQVSSFHDGRI